MLRPPVMPMRAAAVDRLPAPDALPGGCRYEPKWDGWRVLVFRTREGVYLQSRAGRPLAPYFPDLVEPARRALPAGVVVDGELVVWDVERGRTSFTALQRRVNGVVGHPAHLVAFDLLQAPRGEELLGMPLSERRLRLTQVLAGAPAQLSLCPQTDSPEEALDWFTDWPLGGIEGLVVKGRTGPYRPGATDWLKLRHRRTTEAVVGGITGSLAAPETALLGRFDAAGELRFVGRTRKLRPAQGREVAAALAPDGGDHPWPVPLPGGWAARFRGGGPLAYLRVRPEVVAEVETDDWRHAATFVRLRSDLTAADVPLHEPSP